MTGKIWPPTYWEPGHKTQDQENDTGTCLKGAWSWNFKLLWVRTKLP